ncbi:MAG: hypothetical protein C5B59_16125 [Bacteroidetes bacterium]|nr:MAG: hypothetical protein C5B59_16125 [Bacteroidota bacterium]
MGVPDYEPSQELREFTFSNTVLIFDNRSPLISMSGIISTSYQGADQNLGQIKHLSTSLGI